MKAIEIYKGDDSVAFNIRKAKIRLATPIVLQGATAEFKLLDYEKTFTAAEVAANSMEISFSRQMVASWPLGLMFGSFSLIDNSDPSGEPYVLCATTKIPFLVRTPDKSQMGTIDTVVVNTEYASVEIGWSIDYANAIVNKPKINGVEVVGSKIGRDYGLNKITEYSSSATYAVDDQVRNGTKFFRCTTQIATPEAWNVSHWQEIGGTGLDPNSVHYTADAGKSDAEKTQARQNISAASVSDLSQHTSNRNNPHDVSKSQVGLGNVDNTSDANKPVSTAQQTALNAKVAIASLKAAFSDPSNVQLSPYTIRQYLINLYNAIQAIS